VVASSFAIAWKKFSSAESPSLSWLIRIASFELANAERKARRTRNLVRVESIDNVAEIGIDAFDGASVRIALDRLPKTDQEVLRLVHWDCLDRSEIAKVLGLSQNAVNIRYHRALKKFEKEIGVSTTTSTPGGIVP
jgi:RNA polymerase sigma-70 factor (ECF subfamily)